MAIFRGDPRGDFPVKPVKHLGLLALCSPWTFFLVEVGWYRLVKKRWQHHKTGGWLYSIGIVHDQRIIKVGEFHVFWLLNLQWSSLFARFLMEESLVKSGLIRTWRKILPCNDWIQQGVRLSKMDQNPSTSINILCWALFCKEKVQLGFMIFLANEGIYITCTSH